MPNVESLSVVLADGNELAAISDNIDGNSFVEGERLDRAHRPAPALGERERQGEAEGVKVPPPISRGKWCPSHFEAIRLDDAGICPVCMAMPEVAYPSTASTDGRVRPVDCKNGARLNAGRVSDQAEFGAARSAGGHGFLSPCPAKGCAAASSLYAIGSYYGRDGMRDFVWYEVTCVNGHSHLASRLAPEDVEPEPSVFQGAPVPPEARAMFENVVTMRYAELRDIAERALDGGKIHGHEDCVQQAIAVLLLKGSYAACVDEGEMFGQLVVTVQNRGKAMIKRWVRDKKRYQPLAVEDARPEHWSDGQGEIVGEAEHELSDHDKRMSSEVLRPRPVEQTRDLRIDAKWALFEGAVPLEAQAVFVEEATRKEVIVTFDPGMRHLRTTLFDKKMLEHRERLARRLVDYRLAPGVVRKKSVHDGRLVPDYSAHRKFIHRWVDDAIAEFKKARQCRYDHAAVPTPPRPVRVGWHFADDPEPKWVGRLAELVSLAGKAGSSSTSVAETPRRVEFQHHRLGWAVTRRKSSPLSETDDVPSLALH